MAFMVLLLGVVLGPLLRMMETALNLSYLLGWERLIAQSDVENRDGLSSL